MTSKTVCVRAEGPRGVAYLRVERLHRLHRGGQGKSLLASRSSLNLTRVPTQRNTSVKSALKLACLLHHAPCSRTMPFKMAGSRVSRYASRGGRRVTSHLSSIRSVRQGEASVRGDYRLLRGIRGELRYHHAIISLLFK